MTAPRHTTLVIERHAPPPGDLDRQAAALAWNAALMERYRGDRRAAYAAMARRTPMATGIACEHLAKPVRGWWLRPREARQDRAILFIHGGGYHLGDAEAYCGFASQLAVRTGCAVLCIDYPLAPEHPFPAAYDAARHALEWMGLQGIEQVSLTGDSAGGGLVLALLNDPADRPGIASALAFSPWTDLALTGRSLNEPATRDPIFSRAALAQLADGYLAGADPRDPRASPLYGLPDRLPPLAIQVGSEELLLDDARRYARMASHRSSHARLDIFDGMHHVFQRDVEGLAMARLALDLAARFIQSSWVTVQASAMKARPDARSNAIPLDATAAARVSSWKQGENA